MPRRYWIALLIYLVLGGIFVHDWDGYVFETSVRDFAAGRSPYAVAESTPYYAYLNPTDHTPQWYAYPPLPLLAMTVTFAPALAFDLPPVVERLLLKIPIILGTFALAAVAGAWARRLAVDEPGVRRVERLLLFNPFIILVGPVWGMTDTSLMAFLLGGALAFERGRHRLAGVLFGASVLVKPFPLLLALPLLAYYIHAYGVRPAVRAAAAGTAAVVAVCLPFVINNPTAFWNQVVGVHLRREPQGLTVWSIGGLAEARPELVSALSIGAIAISLLALSIYARRLQPSTASLVIVLAASAQILLWNRVVNEQYLVMAIAPLLILYGAGVLKGSFERRAAVWLPAVFALITALRGWHFLRFIPPDVGGVLFPTPESGKYDVTIVVNNIRSIPARLFPGVHVKTPFSLSDTTPAVLVALLLVLLAFVGWRIYFRNVTRRPRAGPRWFSPTATTSVIGCLLLLMVGAAPLVVPASVDQPDASHPLPKNPRVGAFYYLWWDNPAHDPFLGEPYGNWWQASQFPALGYYTQTRGVAATHARMMREHGIEVAVVSYHTGELGRYETLQDETLKEGVYVAPLIELNQIYDRPYNRPLNFSEKGMEGPEKHASYSLSNVTQNEIANYVLELKETLRRENAYRVDGRPVIFFYDSYVSDVGFRQVEREDLARMVLQTYTIEELRYFFNDATLEPTVSDLLDHYPSPDIDRVQELERRAKAAESSGDLARAAGLYREATQERDSAFYNGFNFENQNGTWPDHPKETIRLSAPWRAAHFDLHRAWWGELRAVIEEEVGPVFLVSGDAWNEQAGFYAGTIKNIEDLEVFDGSFIYSPSFTWGVQPRDPENLHYEKYFKLWTYRNLWLTSFGNGMDRFSAFGVAPAYDDTRLIVRNNDFHNISFRIPPEDSMGRLTYDRSWEATLAAPPSLAIIATFNEFFEGSSIEPSREYGDVFLKATRDYSTRLATQQPPAESVLVLAHERASRLQYAKYSETDLPHYWGLKLVAAAGDLFTGGAVDALDGYQTEHLDGLREPSFMLLDGARVDYEVSGPAMDRLQSWRDEGVPTLLVGREIAEPLRALVPSECASGGPVQLMDTVKGEEEAFPIDSSHDDQLNPGDVLRAGTGSESGLLFIEGPTRGEGAIVGKRCSQSQVAFTNIKPWLPLDDQSNAFNWSRPDCLPTVLRALLPETLPAGHHAPLTCRVE